MKIGITRVEKKLKQKSRKLKHENTDKPLRWLYKITEKNKIYILLLLIVQAVHGGSGVVYALLLRDIVDSAVSRETGQFWHYVILTVLLVAAQLVLRAAMRFLREYSHASIENVLKQRLLGQLLRKDYASVTALHSGEWMNRLTSDTVVVSGGFVDILPGIVGMLVKLVSAVVMMIALDARFAAILVPGGLLLVGASYLFRKRMKKLHKNIQEKNGVLRIFLQERIGSMMIIRSFAAEEAIEAQAQEKMADHKNARMKRNRFSNLCNVGLGTIIRGLYLSGVCYCGYGILIGTISYGTLTAITQLISQIQSPFANISGYLPKFYAMTASAERLMEIEGFSDESDEAAASIAKIKEFYDGSFASIEVENVGFTYFPAVDNLDSLKKENQPVVLKNMTLSLRKGETVAFIGESGCGKSTVLKLIMCLYPPDSGDVMLENRSGDRCALTPAWRRLFGYVPQGNILMSGTVREIVSFAERSRADNDDELYSALDIACAGFVRELENGLDTRLGEAGTGLSEGQMQRLAVARAVFSGSPVLLLDEATSALDTETEKCLLENLRKMTDKTVIIVTHRPAALEICDRVLRFTENGVEELDK